MITLRDYQVEAIDAVYAAIRDGKRCPLLALPTGCHAAGTMILMFDGTERAVEDVRVDDLLMGPDSRPRRVLALARGREEMFEIAPKKGDPFVVNIGHILSLATTNEGKHHPRCQDGTRIDNITVREWLGKSKSWQHLRKLRRVPIDFSPISPPTIDPWFAGVMLGDGSLLSTPMLTNMDEDVIAKCNDYARSIGCQVNVTRKLNNRALQCSYSFVGAHRSNPNPLTQLLRDNDLWGKIHCHKYIPHHFKVGSRETRLCMLAGLIDSDGHLDEGGHAVDYVTSSKQLADDIVFMARSLDLAAYAKPCRKGCQNGHVGDYYRVSISGELVMLPLVRRHRRPLPRQQKKRHNVTGFAARYVGRGNFYGFSLDGDHLYLTSDFIVHHNTGKALVLAGLVQRTCTEYPQTRHLILSHVQEILRQDLAAIKSLWPTAPTGVYSAGLRRRDTMQPIILGGCASVINCVEKFGKRDFLIIDECHLLSPDQTSTYQRIIAHMRRVNPDLIVVGLTATPYRSGIGSLVNNGIFDGMALDLTDAKSWARFIAGGYLVPLHAKRTTAQIDVSGVRIVNGDFAENQLQRASDKDDLNAAIAAEIVASASDRRNTLVFCAGIDHAEHMAEELRFLGMRVQTIHSRVPSADRDKFLQEFRDGKLDALTNNNCLTTGINVPEIDLIACCRATVSVNLWVQMLGRGARPAPGKSNCLVLDFAGNRPRLGPVDDPYLPKAKSAKDAPGEMPVKVCAQCGCYAHISARMCENCGTPFPIDNKLRPQAGSIEIMRAAAPIIKTFPVLRMTCVRHARKLDGAISARVSYQCGAKFFDTWLDFETARRQHFAREWWRQHVGDDLPATNQEAIARLANGEGRTPAAVTVWTNKGKYPEILKYEFSHDSRAQDKKAS